jgi:hypothetical protein
MTNDDFITNTCSFRQGWFVVVARIRVRTGEDDEPNHITLTGTLSYQEIQIKEPKRNNTYINFHSQKGYYLNYEGIYQN